MTRADEIDAIGIERLQQLGSVKWSRFPGTIGAFVAEADFGLAPVITEALHRAVDEGPHGYLPTAVAERMSAATAAWQRDRYGWNVDASQVQPIADVLTTLRMVIREFTEPGSAIVLPTPAYMPFLTIPGQEGREVIEVPMVLRDGRMELDLDAIDQALDGAGLFVLCNPYNPLGRVFTREELEGLAAVIARHPGVRVFSDEIHSPLVFAPHRHVPYASISAEAAAHTVTATSASKAFNLPGLKCAQVIFSHDEDAARWPQLEPQYGHGASNFGVVAGIAAYEGGGEWLDETIEYLDGNRARLGELLAELIPNLHYTAPEGTYIAWLDARDLGIDGSPADFFREQAGVALTDGIACGAAGAGHLRFILATPRPILEQAVRQMAAALDAR